MGCGRGGRRRRSISWPISLRQSLTTTMSMPTRRSNYQSSWFSFCDIGSLCDDVIAPLLIYLVQNISRKSNWNSCLALMDSVFCFIIVIERIELTWYYSSLRIHFKKSSSLLSVAWYSRDLIKVFVYARGSRQMNISVKWPACGAMTSWRRPVNSYWRSFRLWRNGGLCI